jgi:hypothetical protein
MQIFPAKVLGLFMGKIPHLCYIYECGPFPQYEAEQEELEESVKSKHQQINICS